MEETSFPEVLQNHFREIEALILERLQPEFVLMAGSFGKGSWLYSDKGDLLSDIELVFVNRKSWSLKDKKRLVDLLNTRFPYKIELKGYLLSNVLKKRLGNYSLKNPGYISLNFFDVFDHPNFLFCKNDWPLEDLCPSDLPVWEAWRLVVNRMAELLAYEEKGKSVENTYPRIKLLESFGDAYCMVNGIYDKRIAHRRHQCSQEIMSKDKELPKVCRSSWKWIDQAMDCREKHGLHYFKDVPTDTEIWETGVVWLEYLENELFKKEFTKGNTSMEFHEAYMENWELQGKYLDVTNGFNILLSNILKWANNRKRLGYPFRGKFNGRSWRHMVLLAVSAYCKDRISGELDFTRVKKVLETLLEDQYLQSLNENEIRSNLVHYWKILR